MLLWEGSTLKTNAGKVHSAKNGTPENKREVHEDREGAGNGQLTGGLERGVVRATEAKRKSKRSDWEKSLAWKGVWDIRFINVMHRQFLMVYGTSIGENSSVGVT